MEENLAVLDLLKNGLLSDEWQVNICARLKGFLSMILSLQNFRFLRWP